MMKSIATNTLISGAIPLIAQVQNGVKIGLMKNASDAIITPPWSIALKYDI